MDFTQIAIDMHDLDQLSGFWLVSDYLTGEAAARGGPGVRLRGQLLPQNSIRDGLF